MSPELDLDRRRRRRIRPRRLLVRALGWLATLGLLWAMAPAPAGAGLLGVTIVSGNSMLPTYESGDAVLTWRTGDYRPGAAIVYAVPQGQVGAGVNVVHRVIEVTPDGYRTQGDNNVDADPWLPTDDDVRGRVVLRVPNGAFILRWIASPLALAAACGMLTAFWVLTSSAGRSGGRGGPRDGTTGGTGARSVRRPRRRHRGRPRRPPGATQVVVATLGVPLVLAALPPAHAADLGEVRSDDLFATSLAASLSPSPITVVETVTSDQPLEYCATVLITNVSDASVTWETVLDVSARGASAVASSYNVETVSFTPGAWRVRGAPHHAVLAPTASATWGYCASRAEPGLTEATTTYSATVSGGEFCVQATVTTESTSWVRWTSTVSPTTPGLTAGAYALAAVPANAWGVQTVSFAAATGTWTVRGAADSQYVRAGADRTWGFCAPLSTSAPPVEATATLTVTSSGGGQYCASVAVSTTSTDPVRWQVTVGRTTPGVSAPPYWLDAVPTNLWSATSDSFSAATGDWVVRGSGSNEFISAAQGATWGYCAPQSTTAPLEDAPVSVTVTSSWAAGYCATVTVSTTSPTPVRWRATLSRTTPGISATQFWLAAQPGNYWNATAVSFTAGTGTWVLRGAEHNATVVAGQPTSFGYCTA